MKIAILHYSAPPIVGGVEIVISHHAALMKEAGHQVTILCGRGKPFDPDIPVEVIPLLDSRHEDVLAVKRELDKGVVSSTFTRLRARIGKQLETALQGFDVLIAHNVASLHKNLALTAALHDLYRAAGFPRLILWHHDLAWISPRYRKELHPGYPWELLHQVWPGTTNVAISEIRRDEFCRLTGLAKEDIIVIPNGVDLYTFEKFEARTIELIEKTALLDADPLLLSSVRLTTRKNIELGLRILSALKTQMPRAKLLITGPEGPHNPANHSYREKLIALRNELELQGEAIFLAEVTSEFLPDEVIADFYRLADGLLFPSREEGFGIPLLEAGFSRIPVFCADIPVLRELGGDDLTYFSPDGDPAAIAQQIHARLKSEATARWSRYVRQHYTWQAVYRDYLQPLLSKEHRL